MVTAIVHDHKYAIKAANDADICNHPVILKKALIEAKNKLKIKYEQEKTNFEIGLNKIKKTSMEGFALGRLCDKELKNANNYGKNFDSEASKETIFGYVHATKLAKESENIFRPVISSYQKISSNIRHFQTVLRAKKFA